MPLESHPFGMDCGKQVGSKGGRARTMVREVVHTHTHIRTYMGVSNLKASEWLGIITYLVVLVYALQLLEASI